MNADILRAAHAIMARADMLGTISEEPDLLTRRFATPAMREANRLAAEWMLEAGMSVRRDNIGNLIGLYSMNGATKTLLLGSHLDTVRDAGKYDGPLGVLVAIACVQRLHEAGARLPFNVEVVAFADEEGLRYHTAYLGSKALSGTFDPGYLALTDADGITLAEAIRDFGGDPAAVADDAHDPSRLLGYCEVHIEQGPVLEAEGLPAGIVSAISGQSRFEVCFQGVAGHAGTVPMQARRDALCAAADFVLAVEATGRATRDLVATVGQLAVEPGASNVIPGRAQLSLDVRHSEDRLRMEACTQLQAQATEIAARRSVSLDWDMVQESPSVHCSPHLSNLLAQAVGEAGLPARWLASGAGHDAVSMSRITEVAMLFVRCKGGVSHNPAESVAVEDVAVAVDVLCRFVRLLAATYK